MQAEQNLSAFTSTKGDQQGMHQPVSQEKNIVPADAKHTASSESSSETTLESEHADTIGTPFMTATTPESGVQIGEFEERKAEEQETSSKDKAKVSQDDGGLAGGISAANKKTHPSEKKSFTFPEKVISCIIGHVFQLSMKDPVTSPVYDRAPPFWTTAFPAAPQLFPQMEYRWRLLRFASWLRDLQSVNDTWAAAVENHTFWAAFLIQRPILDQKSEMGSSKGPETPAWLQRAHPGRKQAKNHSSLLSEAEKTCWLCVLHSGPTSCVGIAPPVARTHIETTAFRQIPVCERHYEMPLCHCCLIWDNPERSIHSLTRQHDFQSFRLADWKATEVCRKCRLHALEKTYQQHVPRFAVAPVPSNAHAAYLDQGSGTAAGAIEHMFALAWAADYLKLELECELELKRMKNIIKNDYLKRNQRCPNLAHVKLPMDKINDVFIDALTWEVDRLIDDGLWISPRTINELLVQAARIAPATDVSEALPVIHVNNPPLASPTLRERSCKPTKEWSFRDGVPPRTVVTRMHRKYLELLPERIERNLKSLKTMIARISDGNMDLAEAKAASMDIDELLKWLNDPRMHIPNWWHGQQIIKPISQADISRVLSSISPAAESVTKRKRDDSDLSDGETGKATKKQDNGTTTRVMHGRSQSMIEVPINSVGPPTPTEPGTQATSSSVPSIECNPLLSTFTLEIVNRLPWPTPQEVLSERECEYLRMTEFDDKKLPADTAYSVPARSTELDDITREILMDEWRSITSEFSACRCSICRRAREYEKLVAAESANPYAEYISLLGGDTKIEDMSDFQRTWLANQAALLNSSVTSPEEDPEQEELQLSEEEDWPTLRNRNELENYSDGFDYDTDEEMEDDVPDVDDVGYHIPGACL